MGKWLRVTIRVSAEAAEAAGEILRDAGASGWETRGADTVVGYLPGTVDPGQQVAALRVRVRALADAGLDPGPAEVHSETIAEEPWAEVWKSYFRPTRVGRVLLTPTWEDARPGPGEVLVRLDPGMAFGSGAHATTRLCLLALQQEMPAGGRVLDIGTGSGILAIAAARLGASRVLAIDNDPDVIPIARANVELNGVSDIVTVCEGDVGVVSEAGWHAVIANIAPDPVADAAPRVRALLSAGGAYIGGGIPASRSGEVQHALAATGFRVEWVLCEEEWVAIVARCLA